MKAIVFRALTRAKKDVIAYLKNQGHFKITAEGRLRKDIEDDDELEDLLSKLPLDALLAIKAAEGDLSDVAVEGGERFLAEIDIPGVTDLFGQVNERAVSYARTRAGELVSGLDESTRSMLATTIAEGLEANRGLDYISEMLQDLYAFSEDRADIIAQTEVAAANGYGTLEGMRIAQSKGVKLKKQWLPDELACDECLANGEQGAIDLDELFQSGDDAPPAHPNCRCDMASEVDESEDEEDNTEGDES